MGIHKTMPSIPVSELSEAAEVYFSDDASDQRQRAGQALWNLLGGRDDAALDEAHQVMHQQSANSADPVAQATAELVVAMVQSHRGQVDLARQVVRPLETHTEPLSCGLHHAALGFVAEAAGEYRSAEASFSAAIASLVGPGRPVFMTAPALAQRAAQRYRTGDWDGALSDIDATEAIGAQMETPLMFEVLARSVEGLIHCHRANATAAAEALRRAEMGLIAGHVVGAGFYALACDTIRQASGPSEAAVNVWKTQSARGITTQAAILGPHLARTMTPQPKGPRSSLLDEIDAWAATSPTSSLPRTARWAGAISNADPEVLTSIASDLRDDGCNWLAAEAYSDAASAAAACGLPADQLQQTATRLRTQCGAPPAADQATVAVGLTPAEQRTANLVCEGLSNGEIASQLGVKVRTVETHLSAAYRKLNVRGRSQLIVRLK